MCFACEKLDVCNLQAYTCTFLFYHTQFVGAFALNVFEWQIGITLLLVL